MIRSNIRETRQKLSYLLNLVENGEEVVILRRHHIIAHIIPHQKKKLKTLPSLEEFRKKIEVKGKPLSQMISEEREKR